MPTAVLDSPAFSCALASEVSEVKLAIVQEVLDLKSPLILADSSSCVEQAHSFARAVVGHYLHHSESLLLFLLILVTGSSQKPFEQTLSCSFSKSICFKVPLPFLPLLFVKL